jgi:hypothetical protein
MPSIRIELDMFVGLYRDNDYVLGPTQEGLRPAIRRVLTIKRIGLGILKTDPQSETILGFESD